MKEPEPTHRETIQALWQEHLKTPFPEQLYDDSESVHMDFTLSKHIAQAMLNEGQASPEVCLMLHIYCLGSDCPIQTLLDRLQDEKHITYFQRLRLLALYIIQYSDPQNQLY
ncbi:MAG: hypothetical protein JW860_01735 [Sedimentisphaerales bacterium]|nr:hypothetical protein [Sedimentisphaerales bacterium]